MTTPMELVKPLRMDGALDAAIKAAALATGLKDSDVMRLAIEFGLSEVVSRNSRPSLQETAAASPAPAQATKRYRRKKK